MNNTGLTLLEIVITLSLIAILLLIAAPLFQNALAKQQGTTFVQHFTAALQFARLQAIRRQEVIALCPSNNHLNCQGEWRDGQIVVALNSMKVLRVLPALPSHANLTWRSSLRQNDMLQFNPNGFTNGQQGSFYYCPAHSTTGYAMIINHSGRARIATNDSTGKPIDCN